MGFFARNVTSGPPIDVEIKDLGITVRVGEDYNLTTLSPADVQNSGDLPAAISGGGIVILDPLDDTTPLSVADSLEAVDAANNSHFRINGGTLNQLDDVDLTGASDDDLLQVSGGTFIAVPPETAVESVTNFREPVQSGLASGGEITLNAGNPTIAVDISAGSGFIIDSYTDPLSAVKTPVSWNTFLNVTVNQLNPVGFTTIGVNSSGSLVQVDGPLTNAAERTIIKLGRVYYETGVIVGLPFGLPRVVNQTSNTFYDLMNFLGRGSTLATGFSVQKVDNPPALSVFRGSGEFFVPGVNWPGTKTDPNVASITADGDDATPAAFDVIFQDGTIFSSNETVIPLATDDGTLTPDSLGTGQGAIHYLLENAGGVRYLQLGQTVYSGGFSQASERLFNDATNFNFFPNANTGGFLLLAQIVVQGNAVDFENTARAGINNILGEGGIASGSGSETDEKVKVTAADTVPNYLNDKVSAGLGISATVLNPGGDETLEFSLNPLESFTLNAAVFDFPTNSDWAVDAIASQGQDDINEAITVRTFDDTTEEGVGWLLTPPPAVTQVTFRIKSRRKTAGGAAETVPLNLYTRDFADNVAPTAWTSVALSTLSMPAASTSGYQYDDITVSLASLSITAGNLTQFELTRNGGTVSGDWFLAQIKIIFL